MIDSLGDLAKDDNGAGTDTVVSSVNVDLTDSCRFQSTERGPRQRHPDRRPRSRHRDRRRRHDFSVFNAPLSAANSDVIKDFDHVADTFLLSHSVMTAFHNNSALDPNFFFAGANRRPHHL